MGYVYVSGKVVTAMERSSGEVVWSSAVGREKKHLENGRRQSLGDGSSLLLAGDLLYFGSDDAYFHALDKRTGKLSWQLWLALPIRSSPAISGTRSSSPTMRETPTPSCRVEIAGSHHLSWTSHQGV